MKKIFISLGRYVQGPGILPEIGEQVALLGDNAFVAGGKNALSITKDSMEKSFNENNVNYVFEYFEGETTKKEIARLQEIASGTKANVIIGVGGGKVIDTAKVVADNLCVPVALVPTIAANDAPCSSLSIVYTEDGDIEEFLTLNQNPGLVFVDTQIIANAPVRYLVAGMGDALTTRFEAEACLASNAKNLPGGHATSAAAAIARLCYDSLTNYGFMAKTACEKNVPSAAFENVVEAAILHSGLGFENVGVAAAHAVQEGFLTLEETHKFLHGEKVAFCTLVQLILENHPSEMLNEVYGFCRSVGLPITLEEIGVDAPAGEKLLKVGRAVKENPSGPMQNMPFYVDEKMICSAIITADALGGIYHSKGKIE